MRKMSVNVTPDNAKLQQEEFASEKKNRKIEKSKNQNQNQNQIKDPPELPKT
jgi:hypothetical protein